ncbi:MAG: hypothetical protein KC636_39320, partial [Myxococcales bacterium]|nr:hypothetical protein [Myxococcales bacterium]
MNAYMWTSRRVGAALVITLVGCGGGDDPEDSSTTDATTAAATAGTSDPSGDPSTTTAGASESDATEPATSDPTTEPATSDPTTTTTDPTTDPSETTDTGVDPGVPAIHYVGRHDASDPSYVRMGWSGVGAVIRFDGTAASVRLDDNAGYFTVVVDGVVQAPLLTSPGDQLYPLAQDLPPGEHVVELYRRTEGSFGPTVILDVELAGELLPPPPVTRRIEVIGDSISCGYGNEGEAPCSFSAATENHYNTYGAFAARAVGAELSTIAWSGKGVVYNYGDDTFEPLPELYDRLLATDAAPWGFDWQPDVVVINLGTNDFSTD